MDMTADTEERTDAQEVVVYRCGWCGTPVSEDGGPLRPLPTVSPDEYIARADRVVKVDGFCCPNGDEPND